MRVGTEWWSLEVEPGWSVTEDPECFTLTKSGLGAFQISAARRSEAPVTLDELQAAARRDSNMAEPLPAVFGGFRGHSVTYMKNGTFWRRYSLTRGRLWVSATYNGSPLVRAAEEPEVEKMLASLRAENGVA